MTDFPIECKDGIFKAKFNEKQGYLVFITNDGEMKLDKLFIPKMIEGFEVKLLGIQGYIDQCQEITVDKDNNYFSTVDGVLFNKDKTLLRLYPHEKCDEDYVIPDGVKIIDEFAFWNDHIKKVSLPRGLEEIRPYSIVNCSSLEEITVPKSLQAVAFNVFSYCKNLKTVNYEGSEEDWENRRSPYLAKAVGNAQINFNYKYPDDEVIK